MYTCYCWPWKPLISDYGERQLGMVSHVSWLEISNLWLFLYSLLSSSYTYTFNIYLNYVYPFWHIKCSWNVKVWVQYLVCGPSEVTVYVTIIWEGPRKTRHMKTKHFAPSNFDIESAVTLMYWESGVNEYINISIYCCSPCYSTFCRPCTICRRGQNVQPWRHILSPLHTLSPQRDKMCSFSRHILSPLRERENSSCY